MKVEVYLHLLPSLLRTPGRYALLFALLARIAIPAGFMPGDVAQGWYLQLCPDGLTPAAMIALLGERHVHNAHRTTNDQRGSDDHCLLSGLSLVALPTDVLDPPDLLRPITTAPTPPAAAVPIATATAYRSRAPPLS